MTLITYQGQGH